MIGIPAGDGYAASPNIHRKYKDALYLLCSKLPTNKTIINQLATKKLSNESSLVEMRRLINIMGWEVEALERRFQFIHVAGTKGKGSVCAFTESILRHHSIKTGLFTSPHLISPCERIKINGKSIDKAIFADSVHEVYQKLSNCPITAKSMPGFFRFILLVALKIFQQEHVDVIILEVGIGGRYDATNFINRPVASAITELALDHTNILGSTLEEIAWNKAGIIKHSAPVYTVPQAPEATKVITTIACHLHVPLCISDGSTLAPDWTLGIQGRHQRKNAEMAIKLAEYWLSKQTIQCARQLDLDLTKAALEQTSWPGRHQIIKKGSQQWFIDGAHTIESVQLAANWFKSSIPQAGFFTLLFHCSEDRDFRILLQPLLAISFDQIIFCPPASDPSFATAVELSRHQEMAEYCITRGIEGEKILVAGFEQATEQLTNTRTSYIFVTGSLYLVGSVLEFLNFCID